MAKSAIMRTGMPSPLGHALAGLAIAIVAGRPNRDGDSAPRQQIPTMLLAAPLVAALPDADLLIPHFHRTATHSLVATAFVMILTVAVTGQVNGRISWRLVLGLGAAHASHVLLDWLGADPFQPAGLQVLWPFSQQFLISGWDVFPPTERRLWDNPLALPINLRAGLTELAIMGPVVGASWLATRRRRSRVRTFDRDGRQPPSV